MDSNFRLVRTDRLRKFWVSFQQQKYSSRKRRARGFSSFNAFVNRKLNRAEKQRSSRLKKKKSLLAVSSISQGLAGRETSASINIVKRSFSLCMFNVRSLNSVPKAADVQNSLDSLKPDMCVLTETWYNNSSTPHKFNNFSQLSRRDRGDDAIGGGVLSLISSAEGKDFGIFLIEHSKLIEMSWLSLHTNVGPILIGIIYRPPDSSESISLSKSCSAVNVIDQMDIEYSRLRPVDAHGCYKDDFIGALILGDFNCHMKSWLRFSSGEKPSGVALQAFSVKHGLFQLVRQPTRGEYLLDLVLSDLPSDVCVVSVLPTAIADHLGVFVSLKIDPVISVTKSRYFWEYRKAKWKQLSLAIASFDWSPLKVLHPNVAAHYFTTHLHDLLCTFIPRGKRNFKASNFPWINISCIAAITRKNSFLFGSPEFKTAFMECSVILRREYFKYQSRIRSQVTNPDLFHFNPKKFFKLSNSILAKHSDDNLGIPPLKNPKTNVFSIISKDKADLLVSTAAEKYRLPELVEEKYPYPDREKCVNSFSHLVIRTSTVCDLLNEIDVSKATGPDDISGVVLKNLSGCLSFPLAYLFRNISTKGIWPNCWKFHWAVPLFKKGSRTDPKNYRLIHLLPLISKLFERVILVSLGSFLHFNSGLLNSQFAFRKSHGTKDLLALEFAIWIKAFNERSRVGLYLSDVSGAFDHVSTSKLLQKLENRGVTGVVLQLFKSYLVGRRLVVIVSGNRSKPLAISNSVYQGVVLGPLFWNLFFQDISIPIVSNLCQDFQFADDVTTSRVFDADFVDILPVMKLCQNSCHKWGAEHQVVFDHSKEFFMILSSTSADSYGDSFKNLGVLMDSQLSMKSYISKVVNTCRWQLSIFRRCLSFFDCSTLVRLYKAYVWPIIEYGIPAYFHCCHTTLVDIDNIQNTFLSLVGISAEVALFKYNMAPLFYRRKWSMLGLLFKISKGTAPVLFSDLFPKDVSLRQGVSTRSSTGRHSLCLVDPRGKVPYLKDLDIFSRSLFGLIPEFNSLACSIIDVNTVSAFQKGLQKLFKEEVKRKRIHL